MKFLLNSLLLVALIFQSCNDDDDPGNQNPSPQGVPEVVTLDVTQLTDSSAVSGGIVQKDNGNFVTERGVCWDTSSNPTINSFRTIDGDGAGNFQSTMTDLSPLTQYYVRAYAKNSAGVGYGSIFSFETLGRDTTITKSGVLAKNETWKSGVTYILSGKVVVPDGIVLKIQAGTIIKAMPGQEGSASLLQIARGGRIEAIGTSSKPIIFTSIADEISYGAVNSGNFQSPNLDPTDRGLWGGIVIFGKAPISVAGNADVSVLDGFPASDQNSYYGGTDAGDDSGILNYVSIRHGGVNIGDGAKVGELLLAGVGSGTDLSNIELVGGLDNGLGVFGGTCNVSNILVWDNDNDQYDLDQAYSGTINNFIGIAGENTDHMMELDGGEGSRQGTLTLQNGSLKLYNLNGRDGGEYADMRDGCRAHMENIFMWNGSESSDFEIDDDLSSDNYKNGLITIVSHRINVDHLLSGNITIDDIYLDKSSNGDAFFSIPPDATIVSTGPTGGANKSEFLQWTWADQAGMLADF